MRISAHTETRINGSGALDLLRLRKARPRPRARLPLLPATNVHKVRIVRGLFAVRVDQREAPLYLGQDGARPVPGIIQQILHRITTRKRERAMLVSMVPSPTNLCGMCTEAVGV